MASGLLRIQKRKTDAVDLRYPTFHEFLLVDLFLFIGMAAVCVHLAYWALDYDPGHDYYV